MGGNTILEIYFFYKKREKEPKIPPTPLASSKNGSSNASINIEYLLQDGAVAKDKISLWEEQKKKDTFRVLLFLY